MFILIGLRSEASKARDILRLYGIKADIDKRGVIYGLTIPDGADKALSILPRHGLRGIIAKI